MAKHYIKPETRMPVEECLCPGMDACAHAVFYTQTDRQLEKNASGPIKA